MELSGVGVAVIGLGVSGVAAARLALAKGGDVYVSDTRTDETIAARGADLGVAGAAVELGGHDVERVARAGLVVVSPGVPPYAPVLRTLAERGVRWISEPELATRFFTGSLIAVTGTNGKTTTTLLIEHLLRTAGISAAAGGIVGGGFAPAACDVARAEPQAEWKVLEMSSFQLGGIDKLKPDIGLITNLSPDHLDRYESVEAYYADKARIADNADAATRWVLPTGDAAVEQLLDDAPGERFRFGNGPESNIYVDASAITVMLSGDPEIICAVSDIPLLGWHNIRNAMAAALTARLAGATSDAIAEGLRSARPLPHRLEPVADNRGVLWVNDSKATNVAAAKSALESLDLPVVLLLGGKDKGEDFSELAATVVAKARAVLAFGAAGARIAAELEGCPVERIDGDLSDVVRRAAAVAQEGDVVLLSPACSSFDMFESYEDRGRRFTDLARDTS